MDSAEACRLAADLVVRAGFELRHRSLKSEAQYFGFPGRHGLLRVAAHAGKGEVIEGVPVLAKLTFVYGSKKDEALHRLVLTRDRLEAQTAAAIGRFMIASFACPSPPDPLSVSSLSD